MKNPVERLTDRLIAGDSQKAVLVFSEKNRRYFTQFPATDGVLLITAEEAYLLMDFRYEEAAHYQAILRNLCRNLSVFPEHLKIRNRIT